MNLMKLRKERKLSNPDEFEGNYAEGYEDEEFETVDHGQDEE